MNFQGQFHCDSSTQENIQMNTPTTWAISSRYHNGTFIHNFLNQYLINLSIDVSTDDKLKMFNYPSETTDFTRENLGYFKSLE